MSAETRGYKATILRPDLLGEVRSVEFSVEKLTAEQLMDQGYAPGATVQAGAPGPGYDALRPFLEEILGGPLEHVSVLWHGKPADMFVRETGRIDGLPRNEEATAIYRAYWLSQHPDAKPEELDFICGPAVLFDKLVWF